MAPGLIGMGLLQFSTLVNLHFASRLGEGAISYIYWADRLLELPLSLVAVSLGAALLPKLADFHWRREKAAFHETLWESFSVSMFLMLPAAVGLFMLAGPLVETLFLRGEFTLLDAANTTLVLKIYALSMIFVSCSRVLASAFYAQKNSKLPALSALFSLVVHIVLAPYLMNRYGLGGLIFSSLIGGLLNFAILSVAISLQIEADQYLKIMVRLARIGVAVSAMTIFLFVWNKFAADLAVSLKLLLGIVLGAGIYFLICQLLRVQELAGLWGAVSKRSKK
jgi:putative peptidoglycan lipid II flippase